MSHLQVEVTCYVYIKLHTSMVRFRLSCSWHGVPRNSTVPRHRPTVLDDITTLGLQLGQRQVKHKLADSNTAYISPSHSRAARTHNLTTQLLQITTQEGGTRDKRSRKLTHGFAPASRVRLRRKHNTKCTLTPRPMMELAAEARASSELELRAGARGGGPSKAPGERGGRRSALHGPRLAE